MSGTTKLDDEADAELHNRLAKQIVDQIVKEPIDGHHSGRSRVTE